MPTLISFVRMKEIDQNWLLCKTCTKVTNIYWKSVKKIEYVSKMNLSTKLTRYWGRRTGMRISRLWSCSNSSGSHVDACQTCAVHDLRAPLIELIPDVSHTSGLQIYLHPLHMRRPRRRNLGSDRSVITGHLVRVKERINPQPLWLIKFNCTTSLLVIINGCHMQQPHLSADLCLLWNDDRW